MNTVINSISTVFERDSLVNFLVQFERIIFDSGIDVKSYVSQVFPKVATPLMAYFGADLIGGNSDELFHKSSDLRKTIATIKVVKISVARIPDENEILSISRKLREITGIPAFIDFDENADLIGGAIIESRGFVTEYSFRKYFEEQLAERGQYGL